MRLDLANVHKYVKRHCLAHYINTAFDPNPKVHIAIISQETSNSGVQLEQRDAPVPGSRNGGPYS